MTPACSTRIIEAVPLPIWVQIDADEVTVGAFGRCVAAGACSPDHFTAQPGSACNYDVEGREEHPMNCVDWYGAEQYCRHAGGRLCEADEWFAACRGPAGYDYPYGPTYDPDACNVTANDGPYGDLRTVPVGSAPGCEGGQGGLRDMVGNVSEWVNDCDGDYCRFYGGAFSEIEPLEDFASCKAICAGNQKSLKSPALGIRCCHGPAPAAP